MSAETLAPKQPQRRPERAERPAGERPLAAAGSFPPTRARPRWPG
jgi:hypothetical protein